MGSVELQLSFKMIGKGRAKNDSDAFASQPTGTWSSPGETSRVPTAFVTNGLLGAFFFLFHLIFLIKFSFEFQ